MRRGALRACALLLRRSGAAVGAASQPAALLAAGPLAAAVGGPAVRRQLWAPWLQGLFHLAAPDRRQEADGGSSDSDSNSDAGVEFVKRTRGSSCGKPIPVRPQLAAELRPLAALAGVADAAELSRRVAALGPTREQSVLEHGPAVADWLLSLGVPQPQLAQLLRHCPLLFSWPADERAALLFSQLARLGLTAAEAARCFQQGSAAAGSASFEPAIPVLAALFAAGSGAGSGRSGEQLLGDLLRTQPAAVGLLCMQPSVLQERIRNLVQRYGPHWDAANKQAVIVTAMQQKTWALLLQSPSALLAREAVLQQELGQQSGDGTRLLATCVQRRPRAAGCSPKTLRQRLLALLAEFGREALLQAGPASLADLLAVDTANWQRALAVWRLLGVAHPAAVARNNFQLLSYNWLAPGAQAKLAALQCLLPWQPTAAEAVQHYGSYMTSQAPARLIGRLLFLQQEGMLPLLVADKAAALREWRRQRGLPANRRAEGEPQLISLRDTAVERDAKFCALLAQAQAAARAEPSGSGGGTAERYRAFKAQLPQLPAYQRLLAEGAAESRRLAALLPPELLPKPKPKSSA